MAPEVSFVALFDGSDSSGAAHRPQTMQVRREQPTLATKRKGQRV